MKVNLMTFNTQHCKNFISKNIDYDAVVSLIKKYKADIIGLNEVYGKGFDRRISSSQVEEIAKRLNYHFYFGRATHLFFRAYGNGIVSKYPIVSVRVIKIPYNLIRTGNRYYERRSIIEAQVDINNKILKVYVVHFGLNKDEQINAVRTLINVVNPNEDFIIMGDFNTTIDDDILADLRKITNDTLNGKLHNKYSWPSDKPKIRYDYILTSKKIKCLSSDIPSDIVSDHLAVIASIEH